jgi:hypothetical protein
MAEKIKLVQGDTRPQLRFIITDDTTGDVVNIAGAAVLLKFRASGDATVLFTRLGTLIAGKELPDGTVTTAPPYDIPGSGGIVVFNFITGNLDVDPGPYEGEIEITFNDGSIQTVYAVQKFVVRADF